MAFTQIGYLGRTGPVFTDTASDGKKLLLVGSVINGVMTAQYKQPAYAGNLGLVASEYTLGTHTDNESAGAVPAYKEPASTAFDGFDTNVSAMTKSIAAGANGSITTSTTTTTTTGGTGTGTSGTGNTDVVPGNSAPSFMEQVQTFLTNYWWVVALVAVVLLWNPVIAPALGMGKKGKRKSYR